MKHILIACWALLGVLLLSGCSDAQRADNDYTVRVMLPESRDYEFLGSQILVSGTVSDELSDTRVVDVNPGQTVRFAVKVEEGMTLECEGDNISYSDGFITVEDVRVPTTVSASAEKIVTYVYSFNTNNKADSVESSEASGSFVVKGTKITLSADIPDGQSFLGYSTGNFLDRGGKLVSRDTEYTFNISRNTTLFANYSNYSKWTINYHPNGGKTSGKTDGTILTDTIEDSFYYCPNSRPDESYFTRDGYVLMGYNTAPDGSGTYYGLGWNIVMPDNGNIDLYCQWAKAADASDFSYAQSGSKISITDYSGDDEFLVIPEYIDCLPVAALARDAFKDAQFKTVFIPKTVTKINAKAFNSCLLLEKVYFPDSIMYCYDDSFYECPSFKTLAPQATHYPNAASQTNFTHQINYERLITRTNNIMLIVSGSTNIYGLTAKNLEYALDGQWDVITYATVASTPNTFYAEVGLHYLDEDDVLIFSPEASPDGHQWGTNYWKDIVWQINEGSYDAISLVDISNYTRVFSSFATYNQARTKLSEKDYEYFLPNFNEYGEHITYHGTGKLGNPWIKWNTNVFFTDENVENFNRVLDKAADAGVPTMIGWMACTTSHSLVTEAKSRTNQLAYMALAKELYHAYFFADLADYIYDPVYVYDSAMHITTEGSVLRTKQMIIDITAALTDLGLLDEE